jgi:plasmid stabilization system protein ParE
MALRTRKIKWSSAALQNMLTALIRIREESVKQAEEVEKSILSRIESASIRPTRYPPDKFKRNNTGYFRAFETHSFRISYRYTKHEIRILRIRHVREAPKLY